MEQQSAYSRMLVLAIALASTWFLFNTSEGCFADADRRNAIRLVKTLRASEAAPPIPLALAQKYPGVEPGSIAWSAVVTETHYGFVRVRAAVPGPARVREYLFDVNLSARRLHPGNDLARELMSYLGSLSEGEGSD